MPRGVPANGFRMTKNAVVRTGGAAILDKIVPVAAVQHETDAEIDLRLRDRFEILDRLSHGAIMGDVRSLIISGAAGVGKSFGVEKALKEWDPDGINHKSVKGYMRPTGIYKLLYQHRERGQVLIIDDADSAFADEVALNMWKAALDTTEVRVISWMTEGNLVDEESAERIPRQFVFEGTVIFITNVNFSTQIDRGTKLAPHMEALVSRSHYIELGINTLREKFIRLKQVVSESDMLDNMAKHEKEDMMAFVSQNVNKFRDLSLRLILKLATLYKMGGDWQKMAKVTLFK
jgi:hypothetical protein